MKNPEQGLPWLFLDIRPYQSLILFNFPIHLFL